MRRKVGAVIVKDNRILSTGYNGAPSGLPNCIDNCNRCYRSAHNIPSGQMLDMCYAVHAEQNAIMNALKTGEDLRGAVLYVNTYPCVTCFKLTVQSGIKEIYYIDEYENEFTKQMAKEAGVELVKLDGSIYRTPVGSSAISDDDMDAIDPLVAQIYKYTPGTEQFKINRDLVFRQNGLYERYDEMIYYTDFKLPYEILPITDKLYTRINLFKANRNTLEYNGDDVKQLVIGAVVYDVHKNELIVLKCKGERFKGKFTMIQGHMAVDKRDTSRSRLKTIMNRNLKKEVTEELTLKVEDIIEIEPMYLVQSNDNKVSSEHMGVISLIKIDTSMLEYKIESGEPEKHDVAHLTKYDLGNMELMGRYDTWLKKVIIKMKEDGRM
jgi:dCMP deaminase